MSRYLQCLVVGSLLLPAVCLGGPFRKAVLSKHRDQKLQAAFDQFPLLEPITGDDGKPAFQTFDLDSPVSIDGVDFYGFRFKVSGRTGKQDFVWSYLANGFGTWDIIARTGKFEGFEDYLYQPLKAYEGMRGLFPARSRELIVQRLDGNLLEDGKYYLVWIAYSSHVPEKMSVNFTFADVPEKKTHNMLFLENILGIHRK
jgi:hypothetical protein